MDKLVVRMARNGAVRDAALRLRGTMFRAGRDDRDRWDDTYRHVVVQEGGRPVACMRLALWPGMRAAADGYVGQRYGLSGIPESGRVLEIGRICAAPGAPGPAMAALLGVMTRVARVRRAAMLFGCSSLPGADAMRHAAALGEIARHARAPASGGPSRRSDPAVALPSPPDGSIWRHPVRLPQPLRTWIALGAYVSDHAVIDADMDTLHVFTGLDLRRMSIGGQALLDRISGGGWPVDLSGRAA